MWSTAMIQPTPSAVSAAQSLVGSAPGARPRIVAGAGGASVA